MKVSVLSLIKIYSVTFRDYLLHPPLSSSKKSPKIGKNEASNNKSEKKEKKIKKVEMSESRVKRFQKIFQQIPDEEKLLNYFSCALVSDILLQGHLYVSVNYFSFYSNVLGYITKLVIPISSVTFITKEKTAKMFPNAIGIQLKDEENKDAKHVFGSFISREAAFQLMQGMVKKSHMPVIVDEDAKEEDDEIDCFQDNNDACESLKEDSSSLSSESPVQCEVSPMALKEPIKEEATTPIMYRETSETTTVDYRETPSSSTILFIAIILTLILAVLSIYLLTKINSIEGRKSMDPLLRDYNQLTIDEAEQVLNRNLMTVRNVRKKLEELQMILETSFNERNSKEEF